jgi:metal-dependent hydrolase (beta-lactamase superfamily II)
MILVGHAHYDHLLDVPYIMKKYAKKAKLYVSKTMKYLVSSTVAPERIHILNEQASTAASLSATPINKEEIGSWVYNPSGKIKMMAINSNHAPNTSLFRGTILDAMTFLSMKKLSFYLKYQKAR